MLVNHISNSVSTAPRLIRALRCQPVDRTPIWIMRQAGRYLPEYRELRARAKSFLNLCKNPDLASEVTLQPLQRFPLDAAIVFSDILTIPDAYGLGLYFEEGEGPKFERPIQSVKDIENLPKIDPNTELKYVMDTIRQVKKSLKKEIPLIGFAGSPWTIACYMIENGSSKHFNLIKKWLYQEPESLHRLLAHLASSITDYLKAQIEAGVDVVMLFDTWGGVLSDSDYLACSLPYMSNIIRGVNAAHETPTIIFTKNGGRNLTEIMQSGTHAIGLDWNADIKSSRQIVQDILHPHRVALQGNLDPAILYAKPAVIEQGVQHVLEQFGHGPGHIFNLGHGIPQDIALENVQVLIEAVHRLSPKFHQKLSLK